MILTLTASIMYWSLLQKARDSGSATIDENKVADGSPAASTDGDKDTMSADRLSNLSIDDSLSDNAASPHVETGETSPHVENEEPSTEVEKDNPPDHKEWPEEWAACLSFVTLFSFQDVRKMMVAV